MPSSSSKLSSPPLGHLKKSLVYHPFQLRNAMRAGRFFKNFYIFFVCPSPAAAYFKAIKQSINKTKLLFIDRLEEEAIIKSINLAKVFTQDVLAHSWIYSTGNKVKKSVLVKSPSTSC